MGYGETWLIFLIGLFAVVGLLTSLLAVLFSGLILGMKHLFWRTVPNNETDSASKGSTVSNAVPGHVFSDTVTGLNVRETDNWFQAIFILISIGLSLPPGALRAVLNQTPWQGGALIDACEGLVFGLLVSGSLLMFYRAVRNLQGKYNQSE